MKKEAFDIIKKEIGRIGAMFLITLVIFYIAFAKENLISILRMVLSLFWLFALPGYSIMLYWHDKLEFMERFVIGIFLAAAIIGISSYYIGLIGLNIRHHTILLPAAMILIGVIISLKSKT
ncbi:hypothetical protein HYW20_08265 [Candidatus Woesearchaeota archaeon]|nr:hypothetical protein [Candidatus Woesearchaeota archaeon]